MTKGAKMGSEARGTTSGTLAYKKAIQKKINRPKAAHGVLRHRVDSSFVFSP
jgi:hypothetical protein